MKIKWKSIDDLRISKTDVVFAKRDEFFDHCDGWNHSMFPEWITNSNGEYFARNYSDLSAKRPVTHWCDIEDIQEHLKYCWRKGKVTCD